MVSVENLAARRGIATPASRVGPPAPEAKYRPGRITNDYTLLLPGEKEALKNVPKVLAFDVATVRAQHEGQTRSLKVSEALNGWQLVALLQWLNGVPTVVFEKHVTHQGAISYVTEEGEIAHIPKRVGDLSKIRPRPVDPPEELGEFKGSPNGALFTNRTGVPDIRPISIR